MNKTAVIQFVVSMIIMMNPLGSLSIFLDLTRKMSFKQQRTIAIRTGISIIIIMLVSLWSGKLLLSIMGINLNSFRCAGGIILLLVGLSMLQAKSSPVNHSIEDDEAAKEQESIAIVPLALPVIIGPGAISALIIMASDYPDTLDRLLISLICAGLAFSMLLALYYAVPIAKFIGMSVIKVVTRIMGMIIMAIAVGMLADGVHGLLAA